MTNDNKKFALLLLEIPRTNDRKELAAEQMFAALHGIYRHKKEIARDKMGGQDQISFEMASIGQRIRFYVWTPKKLQSFVEGQIYAQYPTAQISELSEDYSNRAMPQSVIYTTELVLTDNETIPIKTFPSFEVDPLAAITATLAKLEQPNEEMWVQIISRPIGDEWHRRSQKFINRIKGGSGKWSSSGISSLNYIGQAFGALFRPPQPNGAKQTFELSERDKTRITAIEEKSRKLGYQAKIRILYAGNDQASARLRMQAMVGTFKQFNTTNLNGFQSRFASFDASKLADYQARLFIDKGYILNIEEIASLFHLPHTTVETPNIVWATTKTAEPPSNLPSYGSCPENEISLYGSTNFRGSNSMFGLLRKDRGRHVYILGQTGTGKTGCLELLTLSDIFYDQGLAVIDPHGDYATNVIRYIPKRRIEDVVYFNPADTEFPIGFNPLEITDSASKGQVSSELVGVLKRLFDSWGPRLEYILRFTILALLDYPNSTMLDITKMLTEKKFRDQVIGHIDDPVVKNFWVTEFASWNEKFASEAVAPVLNKVGAFTANPIIRNIVGQPKSTFNIRRLMDSGKILIVNLSRGLVGEDNAAILGSMIVTKIQLASMSRADISRIEDRKPFYLYVDEFQNFATDSFAVILSEARKYGLNLTIANQYISQMEEKVRDAVFGNVGTLVTFRVSPDDSPFLNKFFEPQFEAVDLSNLHNRYFITSMTIDGEKAPAFSATTLNIPQGGTDFSDEIIENSRRFYSKDRFTVDQTIRKSTISTPISYNKNHKTVTNIPLPVELPSEILSESQKRRLRRKKSAQKRQQSSDSNPKDNDSIAEKPRDNDTVVRLR
jgi:DNA helicase HerA-like ATPase